MCRNILGAKEYSTLGEEGTVGVWKGGLCPLPWLQEVQEYRGCRGCIPRFGEEGVIGARAAPLFEPGSWAWGAHMFPLHHWRRHK